MPAYPKSQSLRDENRAERTKGGGLKRTSELSPISKKREAKLKALGLPLNTFGKGLPKDRLQKRMRWNRSTSAWAIPRRLDASTSPKLRKALAKVGRRGKRLAPLDAKFLDQVWAVWEVCPFTGYDRSSKECEVHHCYDKSYRPEWRHLVWVGIPIYRPIHQLVDPTIELKQAFERVADEQRAAYEGRRPDVTPEEVRSIVLSAVPDLMERIGWGRQTKSKRTEAS